jgi:hypothetical protein
MSGVAWKASSGSRARRAVLVRAAAYVVGLAAPDGAEIAEALEAYVPELDQHRLAVVWLVVIRRIEERRCRPGAMLTGQGPSPFGPATGLAATERPEVSDYAMPRTAGCPVRLHEDPIGVLLAALAPLAMFEKHDAIRPPRPLMIASKNGYSRGEVLTTTPNL